MGGSLTVAHGTNGGNCFMLRLKAAELKAAELKDANGADDAD